MEYSAYQTAIFDWVRNGSGHCVVEAVAGSGKTSTIVAALREIPTDKRVLFCAFNKHIAVDLQNRVPHNVRVQTLNSFGWGVCRDNFSGNLKIDANKTRNVFQHYVCNNEREFYKYVGPVCKLVGLLKCVDAKGDFVNQALHLMTLHDVGLPEEDGSGALAANFANATLHESLKITRVFDFDDQIWCPGYFGLQVEQFDYVFVDEAQDLNPAQIGLVESAGRYGRIVAVGDRHQAIYGFRGADPEAINNVITLLKPTVLPLSICYRCPKQIVLAAQRIVPQIECAPNAIDGEILQIAEKDFLKTVAEGDFVLCRVSAPLIMNCLQLIRQGRKATVRGRDLGTGLLTLLNKVGGDSCEAAIANLNTYAARNVSRLIQMGNDLAADMLEDQILTIKCLFDDASSIDDVRRRIEQIFEDNASGGVIFSTVHKAKGLEAKNVFILKPDMMPHPRAKHAWQHIQERNLEYVAITRSTNTLTKVK